jgi:hypothetical protein
VLPDSVNVPAVDQHLDPGRVRRRLPDLQHLACSGIAGHEPCAVGAERERHNVGRADGHRFYLACLPRHPVDTGAVGEVDVTRNRVHGNRPGLASMAMR